MWKVPEFRLFLSVLVVVALLGAAPPAWAQSPIAGRADDSSDDASNDATSSAGQPRIQFTAMEHDFGQALSGENLKTTFTFKNVGDAVLVIEKVKGG